MNSCPCCSRVLLRHAGPTGLYWFCPSCRQAMPNLRALQTTKVCEQQVDYALPKPIDLLRLSWEEAWKPTLVTTDS